MTTTGYNTFTYNNNPVINSYYDVANYSLAAESNPYSNYTWTNLLNGGSGGSYFSDYTTNNVVDFTPTNGSFIIKKKGIYKISITLTLNRIDTSAKTIVPINIRLLNGTSNYPEFIDISASGTSADDSTNNSTVDVGGTVFNTYVVAYDMNPFIRTDSTSYFQYAQYFLASSGEASGTSGNYEMFDQVCNFSGIINVDSDSYVIYPQIYVSLSNLYNLHTNASKIKTQPRILVQMISNVAAV
jgi:hypothetical protein